MGLFCTTTMTLSVALKEKQTTKRLLNRRITVHSLLNKIALPTWLRGMTILLERRSRGRPLADIALRLQKVCGQIGEMNRDGTAKAKGGAIVARNSQRRSASPDRIFHCGVDLWLGARATGRFQGILDRGTRIGCRKGLILGALRGPMSACKTWWTHYRDDIARI
jgi:hypothetical protein